MLLCLHHQRLGLRGALPGHRSTPTWWCLHFLGPGAPLEAGSGPLLGADEALPDVLLATTLLAWRRWRLRGVRRESSVDLCSGSSLKMLFTGLDPGAKKSTQPGGQSLTAPLPGAYGWGLVYLCRLGPFQMTTSGTCNLRVQWAHSGWNTRRQGRSDPLPCGLPPPHPRPHLLGKANKTWNCLLGPLLGTDAQLPRGTLKNYSCLFEIQLQLGVLCFYLPNLATPEVRLSEPPLDPSGLNPCPPTRAGTSLILPSKDQAPGSPPDHREQWEKFPITLLRVPPQGLGTGLFCTSNDMHPSFSSSKGFMSLSQQHCDSLNSLPL